MKPPVTPVKGDGHTLGQVQDQSQPHATTAACDGARKGDGSGGWGYVIQLADGSHLNGSGAAADTTNNRQELTAAIKALEALAQLPHAAEVELATDSTYVRDGLARWLAGWKRNGWRSAEGQPVKNRDLWEQLEQAAAAAPWVRVVWVKGHNGHPLNEVADQLASTAAEQLQKKQSASGLAAVGSAWDAMPCGSDELKPEHLREWVQGSAVEPELVAANVLPLQGSEVLEALAGDRLESLGGHAQQYATNPVARLLRPLEPIAEAGGWYCSGLDPLADWAPMEWGCFKPDQPRQSRNDVGELQWNSDGTPKLHKYEHPIRVATRSFWLRVPAVVAERVAKRFKVALPPEVAADVNGSAGVFWRWVAAEPRLPVVVTEGAKKEAALLSAGIPAVALPGIWNGCKRTGDKDANGRSTGPIELLPDLAALPWKGRKAWVLFDHPKAGNRNPDELKAARRLGRLLRRAGAAEVLVGTVPGTHGKGADDHLAAGGTWEQLHAALAPIPSAPALPRLRTPDFEVPHGTYLADATSIPTDRKAVAVHGPMGSGKSVLIRQYINQTRSKGRKVLAITHRTSLGRAHASEWGLRWAERFTPHGYEVQQLAISDEAPIADGLALCIDSLCETSAVAIKPQQWAGAVVVIDEVVAVLRHALMTNGTQVAKRRGTVLATLGAILSNASQVVVADAQLCDEVLKALEALVGEQFHLIASQHQPARNRKLHRLETRDEWRGELEQYISSGRRVWVSTTAKEKTNGAAAISAWIQDVQPDFKVLTVDSDTITDPNHDAHHLTRNPNEIAARYDAIVTSPAITAGLSVTLRGHFSAVFIASGGTSDANSIAQAAARVRDDVPRYLYAPESSPGNMLRIGNGANTPRAIGESLAEHAKTVVQLLEGGGWTPNVNNTGPWLTLWCELAANQNRMRLAYRSTVEALLQREGYQLTVIEKPDLKQSGEKVGKQLKEASEAIQKAEIEAIVSAPSISRQEAAELARLTRLTPDEKAALRRHHVEQSWGVTPTAAIVEADRDGLLKRLQLAWMLTTEAGGKAARKADQQLAMQITGRHGAWIPDLLRGTVGSKLEKLKALGVPDFLSCSEEFGADDERVQALHQKLTGAGLEVVQVLGLMAPSAGGNSKLAAKLATTSLRRVLALVGHELKATRTTIGGKRVSLYKVLPEKLPKGVTLEHLHALWEGRPATKSPYIDKEGDSVAPDSVAEAAPAIEVGALVELLTPDGSWANGWQVTVVEHTSRGTRARVEGPAGAMVVALEQVRPTEGSELGLHPPAGWVAHAMHLQRLGLERDIHNAATIDAHRYWKGQTAGLHAALGEVICSSIEGAETGAMRQPLGYWLACSDLLGCPEIRDVIAAAGGADTAREIWPARGDLQRDGQSIYEWRELKLMALHRQPLVVRDAPDRDGVGE